MFTDEDKEMAENTIENAAQDLRSDDPMSEHHRSRRIKLMRTELAFLKEHFPDSYILKQDFSDLPL